MISAARSSGARGDVLERITHNAPGAIIDVYTSWEWPALCEAVMCLRFDDSDLFAGQIYDIRYDKQDPELAKLQQSLRLISGGGGNRTAGDTPDSDDSLTVSRTGIDKNTSKEHEENALADILMTMSQIPVPHVMRELAEAGAMFAVFDALRRQRGR
jgi:hypothetical protein